MQYFILFLLLLFPLTSHAQESLNSTGGNATSGNSDFSYSVGQVFYETIDNNTIVIFQGVQIPLKQGSSGINNYSDVTEWQMYPNPVMQELHFSVLSDYTVKSIEIWDTHGRKILTGQLQHNTGIIDVSSLSAGSYYLHFSINQQPHALQFIKQ